MKKTILIITLLNSLYGYESLKYNGEELDVPVNTDSWTRLIFDSKVNADPIYSKEKNLALKKAYNSVFIKYKPVQEVEIMGKVEVVKNIDYSKAQEVELFVSTDNGTYVFNIKPNIENVASSRTYKIINQMNNTKDLLKFETDPVRSVLKKLTKSALTEYFVDGYRVVKSNAPIKFTVKGEELDLVLDKKLIGKLYTVHIYNLPLLLESVTNKDFIDLPLANKRSISVNGSKLVVVTGN